MPNALIINAHHYFPFAQGTLNESFATTIKQLLQTKGYEIKESKPSKGYDSQAEIDKHLWADVVIIQSPVYWMGVPWTFKKYLDEVYTDTISGTFANGDGRKSSDPTASYGMGGLLTDKKYMLSLTFNAPENAFNNPDEPFFAGKSVDDLFLPLHLCYEFFGMTALPTFTAYDVMKNPDIASDMEKLQHHIKHNF